MKAAKKFESDKILYYERKVCVLIFKVFGKIYNFMSEVNILKCLKVKQKKSSVNAEINYSGFSFDYNFAVILRRKCIWNENNEEDTERNLMKIQAAIFLNFYHTKQTSSLYPSHKTFYSIKIASVYGLNFFM